MREKGGKSKRVRREGGGGSENPNVKANKVRMLCLSACDRMLGNRKGRKKKFSEYCHKAARLQMRK